MSSEASDRALQAMRTRLAEWAEWYSRGQLYGLGYASPAMEYALLTQGRCGVPGWPSHREAEEIEAWVNEMAQQHPPLARALRTYYFHPGSLRAHAVALNVSHTQVKLSLDKAHRWLIRRSQRKI